MTQAHHHGTISPSPQDHFEPTAKPTQEGQLHLIAAFAVRSRSHRLFSLPSSHNTSSLSLLFFLFVDGSVVIVHTSLSCLAYPGYPLPPPTSTTRDEITLLIPCEPTNIVVLP